MRNIIALLIIGLLGVMPVLSIGQTSNAMTISSTTAVSQTGRFALKYNSPLFIDKKDSLSLTNFIAYYEDTNKKKILLGPIPGDGNLTSICENPIFLKNENIVNALNTSHHPIQYFIKPYKGCIINIDNNNSAIITSIPKPFKSQDGTKIKYVAIIGSKYEIMALKSKISFKITAEEYFINLLQISQTFSPFSKEIDWNSIKTKGLEFVGKETKTCRGLSAAANFLVPELNSHDLHSFISLTGLDSPSCPSVAPPDNKGLKRWLSVPVQIRKKILEYSSNFHGKELNKHISYLYIPAIEAYDPLIISNKIRSGREALKQANIDQSCGLIVDLRFNLGGSLQSLLLTLGGVIPGGKLFSLGKDSSIYLSDDGNSLFMNPSHDIYGNYEGSVPSKNRNKPIAILTNWMTASSGELTGLALRDNSMLAKIFGTKTSPTASVNATFYLLDGNTLNLMVDRVYNTKNELVPLELPIDESIEDNLETIFDPNIDLTLNAALDWLESLPVCRNFNIQ